ncbi:hypothetical protein TMEC50S_01471 [Thauera mechernichensis]
MNHHAASGGQPIRQPRPCIAARPAAPDHALQGAY